MITMISIAYPYQLLKKAKQSRKNIAFSPYILVCYKIVSRTWRVRAATFIYVFSVQVFTVSRASYVAFAHIPAAEVVIKN